MSKVIESCLSRGVKNCGFHISVIGVIGSGKTTLTESIKKVLEEKYGSCEGLWEPVEDNPILPLYYENPDKYAFPMQIYMLNRRMEQQRIAQDFALAGVHSVQDSSVFSDSCFVEMLRKSGVMTQEECDIYSRLFINMSRDVMYPSLVVYLDCEPSVAMKRIEKRGRECERGIPESYLKSLKDELDIFVDEFSCYTDVYRHDANVDLTPEQIDEKAKHIVSYLEEKRKSPKLSRMGV